MATHNCSTAAEFTAVAASAVSGDVIALAAGTYAGCFRLANSGVTVRGAGASTVIAPDGSWSWAIGYRSDTTLEDFFVGPAHGSTPYAIGPATLSGNYTGVVARRLHAEDMIDMFYPGETGLTLLVEDCVCDGGVMFDMGQGGFATANFTAFRCVGTDLNAFLANGPGTFIGVDCEAEGNGDAYPLVNSFGGDVTLVRGTYAVTGGANPVFKNDDGDGGVFRVLRVTYDTGDTEGTITIPALLSAAARRALRRLLGRPSLGREVSDVLEIGSASSLSAKAEDALASGLNNRRAFNAIVAAIETGSALSEWSRESLRTAVGHPVTADEIADAIDALT